MLYTPRMETLADRIRSAAGNRIRQARMEGRPALTIVSGEIVRELHLKNRTPAVCQVLASPKLQEENGVVLEKTQGPPSGQSTTVEYTYRLAEAPPSSDRFADLWALRGAGKAMYASLGGGEAFLKKERAEFNRP